MRARGRATAALVASLGVLALLVGCVGDLDPTRAPGVVTVAVAEPRNPLTPEHLDDPSVANLLPSLTAGLTSVTLEGAVENDLASNLASEDAIAWSVEIDPDAAFSDGSPVTADSFVEAWRERALLGSELPGRAAFADFLGYSEVEDADLVETGALTVTGERSFEIVLARAVPDLPGLLAGSAFLPLPEIARTSPAEYAREAVGAGPYRLDTAASVAGDHLELVPNPGYSGPRAPANAGISLRLIDDLESAVAELALGGVDVVDGVEQLDAAEATTLLDGRVVDGTLPELRALVIPSEDDRYSGEDGALRRTALALAIDRGVLGEELHSGTSVVADDFLPPTMPGPAIEVAWGERASDVRAQELWRQAQDLFPWKGEVALAVVSGTDDARLALSIAARWEQVFAIKVRVYRFASEAALEEALTVPAEDEKTPLRAITVRTATAGGPGALTFLETVVTSDEQPVGYAKALARVLAATKPEKFETALVQVESRLSRSLPIIPVWARSVSAGYAPGVEGVGYDWFGALALWRFDASERTGASE